MIPSENTETIYQSFSQSQSQNNTKKLRIIHFNDVYNIERSKEEPIGGASRFATILNDLNKNNDCLVVFSGDAVSPSTRKYNI